MKKQLAIFRCTLLILCLMISLPASAADIAASDPGALAAVQRRARHRVARSARGPRHLAHGTRRGLGVT